MHDITRQPLMPLMGDLYGFDPFYLMGQPEPLGFGIQRTDQGYRLEIPVPGFRPEDINVTVEDRQLIVEGRSEPRRFTRAVALPDAVDADRVEANVEHGLLTLTLPLHPRVQPRRIEVKVGAQLPGGAAPPTAIPGSPEAVAATEAQAGTGSLWSTSQPVATPISSETAEAGGTVEAAETPKTS
jgi:HSP20 family protein